MKLKLLIFDLFGTLVFPVEKLKKEDYFVFYRKLGIKLDTENDTKSFIHLFTQLMRSSSSWKELSQKLLEKVIKEKDQKKIELLTNFFKENVIYQLYDDVKKIINLPFKKAILTDASRFLFSNLGLENHFEIFTPKETKFLKPDEKTFLTVLDFFKITPKEALMIGDDLERDITPAQKLGIKAILIDRENKISSYSGIKISSFEELKNILSGL